MFGTDHHTAFDAWWEYARDNYVSWSPAGTAAAIDLYYDPVVDEHVLPTWVRDAGEFTFGFGLGEEHPRGQWNARAMAGWVCTTGAWSDVFNRPNLAKFEQPTVVDVDFPRVAMSAARWDGTALH